MFHELDTNKDNRLSFEEFKNAIPTLERWGVKITDAEASFKEVDSDGGGLILFDEFVKWASSKNLDHDEDDD